MRRSQHLDEDRPRYYLQLMALLGLIGAIQKGDPRVLIGDIGEVDPCAICLESPDEIRRGPRASGSRWSPAGTHTGRVQSSEFLGTHTGHSIPPTFADIISCDRAAGIGFARLAQRSISSRVAHEIAAW